ncbi:hypothetical protein IV38_GL001546 [Lactobacillus selangorensis]|uniref:Uncharacterized protein n=1 Tax=Lactobacillus selangorensis TaxID=81857 RepID=A0A0R2FRA8_9LACO|nr:hypothetical protein [Lactobacillus selangorensis]KRN28096.1 hypothetical protein IV38_GL001546 [Lactobacillus selangorensis]KRN31027.1 hypothetical protein IV40_GL001669 [Lactobacillus selangorensis]
MKNDSFNAKIALKESFLFEQEKLVKYGSHLVFTSRRSYFKYDEYFHAERISGDLE